MAEITTEERMRLSKEFIDDLKKTIVRYEIQESYLQSLEGSKSSSSDELMLLGNLQRELKKSRDLLKYITEVKKL